MSLPLKNKHLRPKQPLNNYLKYSNLALQMIVIILAGVFGGIKLDEWFSLKFPVFTLILTVLSVSGSIYFAIKDFLK